MTSYNYKTCVRCEQEFYYEIKPGHDDPARLLCDTCEAIDPDPHSKALPYLAPEPIDYGPPQDGREPFRRRALSANARSRMRGRTGVLLGSQIEALYLKQRGACAYCGAYLKEDWQLDHVIPLARGGSNTIENVALACKECNNRKSWKTPEEWGGAIIPLPKRE